jgi:hypothetical protein
LCADHSIDDFGVDDLGSGGAGVVVKGDDGVCDLLADDGLRKLAMV